MSATSLKGDTGSSGLPGPFGDIYGVWGDSDFGPGVFGSSNQNYGISGNSVNNVGVYGSSDTVAGVGGESTTGIGVGGSSTSGIGVNGSSSESTGVSGTSILGKGVEGTSTRSSGVSGISTLGDGVEGTSKEGTGVTGMGTIGVEGKGATGVIGTGDTGVHGEGTIYGVEGINTATRPGGFGIVAGVHGKGGERTTGVFGEGGISGIYGFSSGGRGVVGESGDGFGVVGSSSNAGVAAFHSHNDNAAYLASDCCAAWFTGDVVITGTLFKTSVKFQVDHPLDPANKYLLHAAIESPEMKNVYDGVVILDANGEAVVEFPAWFEYLNTDFRYQLTPIGVPGPNLHIAEEISGNRFKIAGGTPIMKVSWQVTGIRQDAWAKDNPMQVEEEKSDQERGYYLHPELYGASKEKHIAQVRHPQRVQNI